VTWLDANLVVLLDQLREKSIETAKCKGWTLWQRFSLGDRVTIDIRQVHIVVSSP
jgi:hypothetical protein